MQSTQEHYLHHDHLGSLSMITNASGFVVKDFYYDPWGASRVPNNNITQWIAEQPFKMLSGTITTLGFTGHEHLDEVGLIHMNGRIYDAKIARFVQADPIIQDPLRVQSLNRYSYVWNNPLNATDPSGFMARWQISGDEEPEYLGMTPDMELDQSLERKTLFDYDSYIEQSELKRALDKSFSDARSFNSMNFQSGTVTMQELGSSPSAVQARSGNNPVVKNHGPRLTSWTDENRVEHLLVVGRLDMRPARGFYSPVAGRIEQSKWQGDNPNNSGYGYYMTLRSAMDNSLFLFAHIDPDSLTVSVGDTVSPSQLLGQYANPKNGGATAPHLHFEWWADRQGGERLDPMLYLEVVIPDHKRTDYIRFRSPHPVHGAPRGHNGYDLVSP